MTAPALTDRCLWCEAGIGCTGAPVGPGLAVAEAALSAALLAELHLRPFPAVRALRGAQPQQSDPNRGYGSGPAGGRRVGHGAAPTSTSSPAGLEGGRPGQPTDVGDGGGLS